MKKILTSISFFVLMLVVLNSCNQVNPDFRVVFKQEQTPLLKYVNSSPAIMIRISGATKNNLSGVSTINLNFNGTDDLNDIDSIKIFYLGKDSLWDKAKPSQLFGKTLAPKSELIFSGECHINNNESNYFVVSLTLNNNANLHHKIKVNCTEVKFNDNTYSKPSDLTPSIKKRIGVAVRKHNDNGVHTYRIPGLTTTNKGTLLATYDARRASSRDLQGDIDIGLSRSTNGGNTWEPMRIALDMGKWGGLPEKFNGVSDASILVDNNSGEIFIAGLWMHGVLDANGKWINNLTDSSDVWNHQWRNKGSQPGYDAKKTSQFLITSSTDDGKSWSEPVNITKICKKEDWWLFAPAPGHGITLGDGTLVFPTQGRDKNGVPFSNITYSHDNGKTWTTSNPACTNSTENMVVQLSDRSLMINMRHNDNRNNTTNTNGRAIAITTDLGKTWTEHPTSRGTLIEPRCMASLHKHIYHVNGKEKSVLLFSNPNSKTTRNNMTIKVSFDDGKTWPEKYWMLLDEGKSRGYSCITSIDENTIGILYEGSRADLIFESIPLKEILNVNEL